MRCLLVVDPQCDFITGSLPVPGALEAMDALAQFIRANDGAWSKKIATCDQHPWHHCSFKENGGSWPRHCAANSPGAAVWPSLLSALHETAGEAFFLSKGLQPDKDEYSIFQDASGQAAMRRLLRGCAGVDICGIAGDVCVLNTLADGAQIFGNSMFTILKDFCPSLDGGESLAAFSAREGICAR